MTSKISALDVHRLRREVVEKQVLKLIVLFRRLLNAALCERKVKHAFLVRWGMSSFIQSNVNSQDVFENDGASSKFVSKLV